MSRNKLIKTSIQESLEKIKAVNYNTFVLEGNWIDLKDEKGIWRAAKVVEKDGNKIKVTFDGWSKKWDEVF